MDNRDNRRLGRLRRLGALVFAATSVGAAAWSGGAVAEEAVKPKIIYVNPLSPGNPFAVPMLKGFELAGAQLGANVVYRGNQDPNIWAAAGDMKRLLEDAIASKPDGLVVSDIYPDVLNDTITAAVKSGIPVVLTNNGFGQADNVGALTFVGTDEHQLGEIGATKLARARRKERAGDHRASRHSLRRCANGRHRQSHRACRRPPSSQMPLEALSDQTKVVNTMVAAIQKDPTIDAIFSLGSCCGPAMVAARGQLGEKAQDDALRHHRSGRPGSRRAEARGRSTSPSTSSNSWKATNRWRFSRTTCATRSSLSSISTRQRSRPRDQSECREDHGTHGAELPLTP